MALKAPKGVTGLPAPTGATDAANKAYVDGTSAPLAYVERKATSASTYTTTSTTSGDIDATNLAVSFTAPASGAVVIRLTAAVSLSVVATMWWSLRSGTTNLAGTERVATRVATDSPSTIMRVTGLTPGTAYTYKWAWRVSTGTGTLSYGGTSEFSGTNNGPATMEVWSA